MKQKPYFTEHELAVQEKLSIMIDIMIGITNLSYYECYKTLEDTYVVKQLHDNNFPIMHDSPQANLSEIGKELRSKGLEIGEKITDDNIISYTWQTRQRNLKIRKEQQQLKPKEQTKIN